MGLLVKMTGSYKNNDAIENVIRYVTRTRKFEQRANELIYWGTAGGIAVGVDPEFIIQQFKFVQNALGCRGGTHVFHEIRNVYPYEWNNIDHSYEWLSKVASMVCQEWQNYGFQAIWAIHYSEKRKVHIHFVVNPVNYLTGLKYKYDKDFYHKRNSMIDNRLASFEWRRKTAESPIQEILLYWPEYWELEKQKTLEWVSQLEEQRKVTMENKQAESPCIFRHMDSHIY